MESARARRAISLIDLTNLRDDCDRVAVDALCSEAAIHGTAAVCVWPDFVAQARGTLAGSGVAVATVVNFPTGDERAFSVATQSERVIADGADEIDVVLPYRRFEAGDRDWAADVLDVVRSVAGGRALVKVILETGELSGSVTDAASFAIEHGADFVKTSTGKSATSATPEAVVDMLAAISAADRVVGIKPSGGISTAADADVYLRLAEQAMGDDWVTPSTFRFGASSLLGALLATTS